MSTPFCKRRPLSTASRLATMSAKTAILIVPSTKSANGRNMNLLPDAMVMFRQSKAFLRCDRRMALSTRSRGRRSSRRNRPPRMPCACRHCPSRRQCSTRQRWRVVDAVAKYAPSGSWNSRSHLRRSRRADAAQRPEQLLNSAYSKVSGRTAAWSKMHLSANDQLQAAALLLRQPRTVVGVRAAFAWFLVIKSFASQNDRFTNKSSRLPTSATELMGKRLFRRCRCRAGRCGEKNPSRT